jgi:putative transposase
MLSEKYSVFYVLCCETKFLLQYHDFCNGTVSLACMKPKDLGYPHEMWTQRLLAEHIRENCIKEEHPDLSKINQGTISKILNASKIKPHKIRYYIAKVDPDFDQKAANVLDTYREAKRLNEKKEKMNKLRR